MASLNVCAMDLGASNGRTIAARYDGSRIELETTHRFPNNYVFIGDYMYWDVLSLFYNLKKGLNEYAKKYGPALAGIGIDTWGVDFGLLDANGQLIANPRCYRDPAFNDENTANCQKLLGGRRAIFNRTGIATLNLNTLYQLYSMASRHETAVEHARTLLFTPDLLNYFFSGVKNTELSIASTSQLYDVNSMSWAADVMKKIGVRREMFTDVNRSGRAIGKILPAIEEETGVKDVNVISVAAHDTASAVAAIPAAADDFAFISSGTWSLIGVVSDRPLMSDHIYNHNISNEATADGRFRPLINITGLWITQELKRYWDSHGREMSFDELEQAAVAAPPFKCFIRPDDFGAAGDMPRRIQEFCRATGQAVPETVGEIMRCAFESIALRYRWALEGFAQAGGGKKCPVLHIVGGGIRNKILNQFAADATGLPVVCGPVEATATGNILVQLQALGEIGGKEQLRDVVANSFPQSAYEPKYTESWDGAYERFIKLYG